MDATLSTARQTAEAAFAADPSDANLKALQAAGKAEMDAYLADFDARHAADETVTETVTETVEAPKTGNSADWTDAQKDAYRAETARMMARIARSMDESNRRMAGPADTRPHAQAYRQYISDGLADTDGHFAPLDYDRWVHFFA